jgi:hypothetical protein
MKRNCLLVMMTVCAFVSVGAQGPNEIQTHGRVCSDPARPCANGGIFSENDLSFTLPRKVEWQKNYYSESFYAIILKSKPAVVDEDVDSANCRKGFFPETERKRVQMLFPSRKVFRSEFGCYMPKIAYTNTNFKYNFVAVYAGETQAEAMRTLAQVKAMGQFEGANVRRMQVVFQNGD